MPNQTFSKHVDNFNLMADGITTRLEGLTGVGISAEDAAAMRAFAAGLTALNAAQEDLKAQLKAKTEEVKVKMAEGKAKYSDLGKRVKIAAPKEDWVAFGITAKR